MIVSGPEKKYNTVVNITTLVLGRGQSEFLSLLAGLEINNMVFIIRGCLRL